MINIVHYYFTITQLLLLLCLTPTRRHCKDSFQLLFIGFAPPVWSRVFELGSFDSSSRQKVSQTGFQAKETFDASRRFNTNFLMIKSFRKLQQDSVVYNEIKWCISIVGVLGQCHCEKIHDQEVISSNLGPCSKLAKRCDESWEYETLLVCTLFI